MMAKHLAVIASEWVWDVRVDFDNAVFYFEFLWNLCKGQNVGIGGDNLIISGESDSFNVCNKLRFKLGFNLVYSAERVQMIELLPWSC